MYFRADAVCLSLTTDTTLAIDKAARCLCRMFRLFRLRVWLVLEWFKRMWDVLTVQQDAASCRRQGFDLFPVRHDDAFRQIAQDVQVRSDGVCSLRLRQLFQF